MPSPPRHPFMITDEYLEIAQHLTFDDASHTYYYKGVRVPSVTQLMRFGNLTEPYKGVDPAVVANAGRRGSEVHKLIEGHCAGMSVTPTDETLPYFNAYLAFCEDYNFKLLLSEVRLYSKKYRYAGTVDAYGDISGGFKTIVDFKCSWKIDVSVIYQLQAYRQMWKECFEGENVQIAALHLRRDGTYKYWTEDEMVDYAETYRSHNEFLTVANLFQWVVKHRGYPDSD